MNYQIYVPKSNVHGYVKELRTEKTPFGVSGRAELLFYDDTDFQVLAHDLIGLKIQNFYISKVTSIHMLSSNGWGFSMSGSGAVSGFAMGKEVTVEVDLLDKLTWDAINPLQIVGQKRFFKKDWQEFGVKNSVVIEAVFDEHFRCLFADGKRRLVPRDVIEEGE